MEPTSTAMTPAGGGTPSAAPGSSAPAPTPTPSTPSTDFAPASGGSTTPSLASRFFSGADPSDTSGTTPPAPAAVTPSAPAPAADSAQTGEQPPASPTEAQRVADAQRRMHQATQEASQLRKTLDAILRDAAIGSQAQTLVGGPAERTPGGAVVPTPSVPAPPAPGTATPSPEPAAPSGLDEAWLKAQFEQYEREPDNFKAFVNLLNAAKQAAVQDVGTRLRLATQRQQQAAHVAQVRQNVAQAINESVKQAAPDVPLRLFWKFADDAKVETPGHLTDPAERLEWQTQRAIALARAELEPIVKNSGRAAAEAEQIRNGAAGVMPAGGTPPVAGSAPTDEAPTFAQQLIALRRRGMGARV